MSTVEDDHSVSPAAGVDTSSDGSGRRRRRLAWVAPAVATPRRALAVVRQRRGRAWLALGAALIAVGAGAWWAGRSSAPAEPTADGPVATAVVERGTISATETWNGTLGHGMPVTVTARAGGTVTRLAEEGTALERGAELFRLDEQPVILLFGEVPMFRDLRPGSSGADVEQLEADLAELGYEGLTVDEEYTASTAAAVRAWQADLGRTQTGTVARGDVVFVPDAGRVDARRADVGDLVEPGRAILDITGSADVVRLEVDVDDRTRLEAGTAVTVVLPGDREVRGKVTRNALVEVAPEDPFGETSGDRAASTVARVEVTLDDEVPDDLIGAPAEVIVAIEERENVLLVPVNALLALAEGGYGLEVVNDDGSTSIVGIDTGLFANGKVQVSGEGLDEGTVVVTAGR